MIEDIKQELNQKISAVKQHLTHELATVRGGRANAAMLEGIQVNVYEQKMPIANLATVSVPEARQLLIQPWDRANIGVIEKAVMEANLGVGVVNEGDKIRVTIPPLSNERREELVKLIQRMAEEARVSVRNLRREANDALEQRSQQGGMSEDEIERGKKEYQTVVDAAINEIDELTEVKAQELRSV